MNGVNQFATPPNARYVEMRGVPIDNSPASSTRSKRNLKDLGLEEVISSAKRSVTGDRAPIDLQGVAENLEHRLPEVEVRGVVEERFDAGEQRQRINPVKCALIAGAAFGVLFGAIASTGILQRYSGEVGDPDDLFKMIEKGDLGDLGDL